jgi:DNA-binding HxlR family transcriptional regulator
MLIVCDVFSGVHRFEEFQRRLGVPRSTLSQRLGRLVEHGVLDRRPYCERPPRFEYYLTAKGEDLWPVLTALRQWQARP